MPGTAVGTEDQQCVSGEESPNPCSQGVYILPQSYLPRPHWEHPTKLASFTKGPNLCVRVIGKMDLHCTLTLKGSCVFQDITSHTQAVMSQKWKWGTCWEENMNLVFIHPCII